MAKWRGAAPGDGDTYFKYADTMRFKKNLSQELGFVNQSYKTLAIGSVSVHVDIRKACDKLGLAFSCLSDEIINNTLYNTLNRACAPALTEVRRAVAKQTSIKYGRVMSHIKDKKAHPNNLTYRIIANDSTIPLHEFMVSGDLGKTPTVKVWHVQRKLKGSFVFKGKLGTTIVKRIAKHQGGIGTKAEKRKGPAGVKMLWGPNLAKEMLRPGFEALQTVERIPARVEARLPHELEQAVIRAKARSGT